LEYQGKVTMSKSGRKTIVNNVDIAALEAAKKLLAENQ